MPRIWSWDSLGVWAMNWQPWAPGLASWPCPVLQTTGCVCVCVCVCVCARVWELVVQLCLTLCDPVDGSPPGSSVHGILQAGIQAWVAMPSSCTVPLGKPWWKKVTQMKPTGPGLERTFTLLRIFFLCALFSYLFPLLPSSWEVSCLLGIFLRCT